MIAILISIVVHLVVGSILALVFGFVLTCAINPTASPVEVWRHWVGTWEKNRDKRNNSDIEAAIAEAVKHNRHVDKHGGTYKSIVIHGRRY